ncbi:MAG TPA: DUF2971 domain-containing protein [Nitrospirales bacterium]|nr:DUF2971 domain-containing protein [Nitrospirales bacterium]
MKPVDEFFTPKTSRSLYHYTGIGGLQGIVETRKLWASHAYYLNDSKELLHACEVLGEVLSESCREYKNEERDFLEQFTTWLETFRRNAFHVFIFSLSEERSLLSQWRSYTPHGKGVSIGFSSRLLNRILQSSGFRLAKCLYKQEEQFELMKGLLERMLETFRQRLPHLDIPRKHSPQKYHGFLAEFRGDLLQVLSIIKHQAFEEEREWRIVSPYFENYTVPEIKFREGASMLMPYIEIDLSKNNGEQELFEEVILGPSQHDNLSMSALTSYLSNKKACQKTGNSNIPFRKW